MNFYDVETGYEVMGFTYSKEDNEFVEVVDYFYWNVLNAVEEAKQYIADNKLDVVLIYKSLISVDDDGQCLPDYYEKLSEMHIINPKSKYLINWLEYKDSDEFKQEIMNTRLGNLRFSYELKNEFRNEDEENEDFEIEIRDIDDVEGNLVD